MKCKACNCTMEVWESKWKADEHEHEDMCLSCRLKSRGNDDDSSVDDLLDLYRGGDDYEP